MYPLVTIGMPTCNRAGSYLRQSLESAVNQTYPNIEIVVSDNCSTDDTEAVVKKIKDSRIRYFKQTENIGPYKNFNFCLQQANGKYFLILSDDDLIDPDFINVCLKAANYSTGIGIIRTGIRIIDSQGMVIGRCTNDAVGYPTEELFLRWFANKTGFYPCSSIYNTENLKEIGGFHPENNFYHDDFVFVKLAAKFGRVDVKEIKASYRKHQSGKAYTSQIKSRCEDSLLLIEEMCNLVSNQYREPVREAGLKFFVHNHYKNTKTIKSPIRRLSTYLFVYRKFDYVYSPIRYFIFDPVYSTLRSLKYAHILSRLPFIKKLIKVFDNI